MEQKEIFKVFGVKNEEELAKYCAKESEKLLEELKESPEFMMAVILGGACLNMASSKKEKAEIAESATNATLTIALGMGMGFILEKLTEPEKEGTEE